MDITKMYMAEQMAQIMDTLNRYFGSEHIKIEQDTSIKNIWWLVVDGEKHHYPNPADVVEAFLKLTQKA